MMGHSPDCAKKIPQYFSSRNRLFVALVKQLSGGGGGGGGGGGVCVCRLLPYGSGICQYAFV